MAPLGAVYVPGVVKVADLLDVHGLNWDKGKLQQVFSASDANDVQQIVVGGEGTEDVRAWNFTKNGIFSVRSAYYLGMSTKMASKAMASSSNPVAEHKSWMELWATDVPNKMKIHAWRMITNGLAVGVELHRRRVKQGVFCIACGREETILHRFWRCPHSAMFWKLLQEQVEGPLAGPPKHIESVDGMRAWILEVQIGHERD